MKAESYDSAFCVYQRSTQSPVVSQSTLALLGQDGRFEQAGARYTLPNPNRIAELCCLTYSGQ